MHVNVIMRSALNKQGQNYIADFENYVKQQSGAKRGVVFREYRNIEVVFDESDEDCVMEILNRFKLSIWQEKADKIIKWLRLLHFWPFDDVKNTGPDNGQPFDEGWVNIIFMGKKRDDKNAAGFDKT